MGNTQSKFKRKSNKIKVVKQYIIFRCRCTQIGESKSPNQKRSERGHRCHL